MNKFDKKDSFVSTSTMSSTSSNGSRYAMDNTMNNNSINKNSPPSSLASSSNHSNYWQPWEDDILRKAVAEIGPRRWKEIASRIPTRTHVQCMQRWNKVLEPSIKKGSWTPEEDKLLTELVIQNGLYPDGDRGDGNSDKRYSGMTGRWTIVSKSIPGRTPKQCRERWILNLDPNINRAPWTEAEDYLLIQLQQQFGNKWSLISKSLPGRTENSVKTRFRSFSRKQQKLNNAKATTSMPTASVNLEQNVESDIKPELDSINRQIQHHFNGSNSIVQDHVNSLDINSDQQHISKDNESLIGDGSLKRKRASDAHADENSSSTNVIDGSSELKKQRVPESLHLIKDDGLSSIGHGNMLLPTQEQVVTPRRRLTPPMLSTHSGNSALYSNDLQVSGYPHFHQSALHYLPNPFDQTRRLNLGKGNSAEQANSDNQSSVFNMQQQQQQQQQNLLEQAQQQQHNQIVMQLLQSSPSPSAVKSRTGSLRRFGSNGSAASNSSTSSGGNENNTNRLSVILSSSVLFPSNPHFSSTSQYMQSPTSLALADANLGKYLNAATAPLLTQNANSSSLLSNSLGSPLPNILGHKNDAIEWIVRR